MLQLPILSLVVPYLLPGQGGADVSRRRVEGAAAGGVWRIEQMTLESALVQLIVQGTVHRARDGWTWTWSRANLDAGGLNPCCCATARQAAAIGPVPVGLIFQATELLSNRVVRLRISGTTKTPHITVEPLRVLSEEAVRFFLTRTLLPGR